MTRLFYRLIAAVLIGMMATAAFASPANPQKNVDYQVLKVPQPTNTGKKIEVIEFFGYFCPHCYAFDTTLTNWARKQKKISFSNALPSSSVNRWNRTRECFIPCRPWMN